MNADGCRPVRFLLALAALSLLAGCATVPRSIETAPEQAVRAGQADVAGRYAEAAALWEEAAAGSRGAQQQDFLLRAAGAWWQAGDGGKARVVLAAVDERRLEPRLLTQFALLQTELALSLGDAEMAEFYLDVARGTLDAQQQVRFRLLRNRLARLRTDPSSQVLSQAAAMVTNMGVYNADQGVAFLKLVEDAPSATLRDAAVSADPILGAWLELALRLRTAVIGDQDLGAAAADWAATHPAHQIDASAFAELARIYRDSFPVPGRIAVLLPTEGSLASAGAAIRDGLISAYLHSPRGASLRFYPTGEDPQSAVSAYFQAMGDGADWIIGPLRRESAQALAELGSLGAPVLALNSTEGTTDAQPQGLLFSLSLSQEEEARSIAHEIIESGQLRAICLAVDTSWGARMESAFIDAFTLAGGEVITAARFSPGESDHSGLLTRLLKIDQSHERRNRLQATLGLPLVFEPSRRNDFDVFFLAAGPEQGRQIRPQLRFHDAGEKPVVAMGRIYSGALNPARDQDLNDIVFPFISGRTETRDAPSMPVFSSVRGGSLGNLYALGADAWGLIAWLPLMRKDPDLAYPGAVGSLRVSSGNRLSRQPAWWQFTNGRPQPFAWPAME